MLIIMAHQHRLARTQGTDCVLHNNAATSSTIQELILAVLISCL